MDATQRSPAASAALAAPLIGSVLSARRLRVERKPSTNLNSGAGGVPAASGTTVAVEAPPAAGPSPSGQPLPDLRCLNGLRVASCLAVMLFHCWLGLWQGLLPYEVTAPLTRHHWFVR